MLNPAFSLNGRRYDSPAEWLDFVSRSQEGTLDDFTRGVYRLMEEWLAKGEHMEALTSGSTGTPSRIQLSKEKMRNSALMTAEYFGLQQGARALLCLAPSYIAGKMMLIRAMVNGWELHAVKPSSRPLNEVEGHFDFCAMVPLQLYNSMKDLGRISKLLIGGSSIADNFLKKLKESPAEVFQSYGMTETITHVAVRKISGPEPEEYYHALPGVTFYVNADGCLVIEAPHLADGMIKTKDLVELRPENHFNYLGRFDNVINSGGIKIIPERVERKISNVLTQRFFVYGLDDEKLGQRQVLFVEGPKMDTRRLDRYIEKNIKRYYRPKQVIFIEHFQYTHTGKVSRSQTVKHYLEGQENKQK